ncbi:MAG: ribosome biogenesis GTP-binding protein YsxC [Leptospiraceae bacterium]|nr:ribosome biogenesis GTP-binding protein YsxC [Leptospiraceae bacterium]
MGKKNQFKIQTIVFHSSHGPNSKIPENPSMPQVAFTGRSNAGKSSLINAIVNRKDLVKVSSNPGKTKSINLFLLNDHLFLVDLPGFGYAKASKEQRDTMIESIHHYLNGTETLKALFVLCDAKRELPEDEIEMIKTAYVRGMIPVLVRTKVDKLNQKELLSLKNEMKGLAKEYPNLEIILSSTKSMAGIEVLRKILLDF